MYSERNGAHCVDTRLADTVHSATRKQPDYCGVRRRRAASRLDRVQASRCWYRQRQRGVSFQAQLERRRIPGRWSKYR